MEPWDILDRDGNKTGKTVKRGKTMGIGEYHLIVNIWIKNNNGEFLITKRTPNKKTFPNMWETTCGAVISGEDSLESALREVKEELNIELSPTNGKCLFRLKRRYERFPDFVDVWLFNEDVDITKVVYQSEEVCGAKWATPNQIQSLIETGKFTDTFTYIENLFKIV
ncbi:NUDIX domain-containing protein [uncultured Clostridium sp.]|uniref:NUDIX hydrolase n=1 Tax=uncultured Clostridium sp. TaxID=59620 RepID=UPI0028EFE42D|nr:NUDIX domain-containing protein [uncultured Clostridium sp.]